MQAVQLNAAYLKKRKFLMVLPLLVLPFLIVLFFILGGGKGVASGNSMSNQVGINMQLPDAHFGQKKDPGKMGLYESTSQDSDKWKAALKNDPYRLDSGHGIDMSFEHSQSLKDILEKTSSQFPGMAQDNLNHSTGIVKKNPSEIDLQDKLLQLQQIVNAKPSDSRDLKTNDEGNKERKSELKQTAEKQYSKGPDNSTSADPDLAQLDKMLDKLMIIQHPEKPKDIEESNKNSIQSGVDFQTLRGSTVASAIIPEKQTLVSGAIVRIQLAEPVKINGIDVSDDQFLYGTASLSNERLKIQVKSIRIGNNIQAVSLTVYDLDGLEGIYIPGSISRDVSKQSLDQGISGMGLTAVDPSIGAQAASAGIQAAKTLLSRKVKLIEVSIPAGYQVLLKGESR